MRTIFKTLVIVAASTIVGCSSSGGHVYESYEDGYYQKHNHFSSVSSKNYTTTHDHDNLASTNYYNDTVTGTTYYDNNTVASADCPCKHRH